VIALDVLRAISREPDAVQAFDAEVSLATGAHPLLDAHVQATRRLLSEVSGTDASTAALQARRLVEMLALSLQASLLVRHSPTAVSDAFIAARLGEFRGSMYGVLSAGADTRVILERH